MSFTTVEDVERYARMYGSGALELRVTLGGLSVEEEMLVHTWRAMQGHRRAGTMRKVVTVFTVIALVGGVLAMFLADVTA